MSVHSKSPYQAENRKVADHTSIIILFTHMCDWNQIHVELLEDEKASYCFVSHLELTCG